MRTTSNSCEPVASIASRPLLATTTVCPAPSSTRTANFWLMALSSASRMRSGRGRAFVASGVRVPPYGPGAAASAASSASRCCPASRDCFTGLCRRAAMPSSVHTACSPVDAEDESRMTGERTEER